MNAADYWKQRSENLAQRQFDKADEYEASLTREYAKASAEIKRSIDVFYQRYAINGEVSLLEAKKALSRKELKQQKMTLEEFIAKAKDNADGRWTQQLNGAYFKTRVSRLEALNLEIRQQVELLTGSRQKGAHALLGDIYKDSYYRTIFDVQQGVGMGVSFAKPNQAGVEQVLKENWAGSNFSKRIWGDRDKLTGELQTRLTQAFIRGDSNEKIINELMERMDVSRSNAERLVQTESAYFTHQGTAAGYRAGGVVKKYKILATLDKRTSNICRSMDGKVFDLSEMDVSVNYPPFHARCRTTIMPYFGDDINVGKRIARDDSGKSYKVLGDMTYPQWAKQHAPEALEPAKPQTVIPDPSKSDVTPTQDEWYNQFEEAKPEIEKHYDKIAKNEPQITARVSEAVESSGGEMVGLDFRLKTKESFMRKVQTDFQNDVQSNPDIKPVDKAKAVNDILRYTGIAEDSEYYQLYAGTLIKLLNDGITVKKVKNTWNDDMNPYKGVNVILTSGTGVTFELQFHTPQSFDLKQNQMHRYYEEYRLPETSKQRRAELLGLMLQLSNGIKKPPGIDQIK